MTEELNSISGELRNRELQDSDLAQKWLRDLLNSVADNLTPNDLPLDKCLLV